MHHLNVAHNIARQKKKKKKKEDKKKARYTSLEGPPHTIGVAHNPIVWRYRNVYVVPTNR
jgi:hypothetical protein